MDLGAILRRTGTEAHHVARGRTPTHERLRDRLVAVTCVTAGADLIFSVLVFLLEHGRRGSEIDTFGSAVFWTSSQLLTVSSSMANPVSAGGRVLDVLMEAYAVTVVATLAGSMGAFLLKRGEELELRPPPAPRPPGSP
jgi:hypothetical protein